MRISDWSSDVCSSDLSPLVLVPSATPCTEPPPELVPSAPSPLLLLLLLPFLLSKLSPTSTTGPMCPPSRRSLPLPSFLLVVAFNAIELTIALNRSSCERSALRSCHPTLNRVLRSEWRSDGKEGVGRG